MCDPYILYSFERSIFQAVDTILAILLLLFLFYVSQTVTIIKLTRNRVSWGKKSGVTVWETVPFSRLTFLTSTNPQTFVSIRFSFSDCAWLIDNK